MTCPTETFVVVLTRCPLHLHGYLFLRDYLMFQPHTTAIPVGCQLRVKKKINSAAAIAQLGERQTEDLKVPGSIPGLGKQQHCADAKQKLWKQGERKVAIN